MGFDIFLKMESYWVRVLPTQNIFVSLEIFKKELGDFFFTVEVLRVRVCNKNKFMKKLLERKEQSFEKKFDGVKSSWSVYTYLA